MSKRRQQRRTGPKGTRYFYAYSENMLGRAIADSGLEFFDQRDFFLENVLIDVGLPVSPRDSCAEYGVLYHPRSARAALHKAFGDVYVVELGHCEEHSQDNRLTFLRETKEARQVRKEYSGQSPVSSGLLGTGWRPGDLGYFLNGILFPLQGAVYRNPESKNMIAEAALSLQYQETYACEGISPLRYTGRNFFGKPARNMNPHKITIYTKPVLRELSMPEFPRLLNSAQSEQQHL